MDKIMAKNKEDLNILNYLPEISNIKNEEIKEKTIKVWQILWNESKFNSIEDVPVSPDTKFSHILHNRSVIKMAIKVAEVLKQMYKTEIDFDVLISSAALQDVSKLVEMEPDEGGGIRRSKLGKMFQHGFYAAHMALEVGLPSEIAENIVEHTFDNSVYPKTLVSKILFYVDQIDMAGLGLDRWKKVNVVFR